MGDGASSYPVTGRLRARLSDGVIDSHAHRGDETVVVRPERYHEALQILHNDPECDFDFLADLTAVDRLKLRQTPRFEIVVHLYSTRRNARIRLKTRAEDDAAPAVDSIVDVYPAANWPEREVWDMFGVRFLNHPNLKRILMYEEFVGHPLRKDYPVNKRQPLVEERRLEDDHPGMTF